MNQRLSSIFLIIIFSLQIEKSYSVEPLMWNESAPDLYEVDLAFYKFFNVVEARQTSKSSICRAQQRELKDKFNTYFNHLSENIYTKKDGSISASDVLKELRYARGGFEYRDGFGHLNNQYQKINEPQDQEDSYRIPEISQSISLEELKNRITGNIYEVCGDVIPVLMPAQVYGGLSRIEDCETLIREAGEIERSYQNSSESEFVGGMEPERMRSLYGTEISQQEFDNMEKFDLLDRFTYTLRNLNSGTLFLGESGSALKPIGLSRSDRSRISQTYRRIASRSNFSSNLGHNFLKKSVDFFNQNADELQQAARACLGKLIPQSEENIESTLLDALTYDSEGSQACQDRIEQLGNQVIRQANRLGIKNSDYDMKGVGSRALAKLNSVILKRMSVDPRAGDEVLRDQMRGDWGYQEFNVPGFYNYQDRELFPFNEVASFVDLESGSTPWRLNSQGIYINSSEEPNMPEYHSEHIRARYEVKEFWSRMINSDEYENFVDTCMESAYSEEEVSPSTTHTQTQENDESRCTFTNPYACGASLGRSLRNGLDNLINSDSEQ